MRNAEKVLALAEKRGMITAKDLEEEGISRNYLYMLQRQGLLERRTRGIYTLPDPSLSEHALLAEVSKRVPRAVVCLISALSFHGLTTQIPNEIWIAVPRAAWKPRIEYPPVNLTYLSGDSYTYGIQQHQTNGVAVKVYSPAKTVADCFKFRNKVGLDVAIEALRECWRARQATMDELTVAADINRVTTVMRPYMETIV